MSRSRVALVRGDSRYRNIRQALNLLTDGVDRGLAQALSGKQRVLVKPNFVVTHMPLAATHTDAMRAVLDFVRAHYDGPITIAEGPSVQPAAEAFHRYGYGALALLCKEPTVIAPVADARFNRENTQLDP